MERLPKTLAALVLIIAASPAAAQVRALRPIAAGLAAGPSAASSAALDAPRLGAAPAPQAAPVLPPAAAPEGRRGRLAEVLLASLPLFGEEERTVGALRALARRDPDEGLHRTIASGLVVELGAGRGDDHRRAVVGALREVGLRTEHLGVRRIVVEGLLREVLTTLDADHALEAAGAAEAVALASGHEGLRKVAILYLLTARKHTIHPDHIDRVEEMAVRLSRPAGGHQ